MCYKHLLRSQEVATRHAMNKHSLGKIEGRAVQLGSDNYFKINDQT